MKQDPRWFDLGYIEPDDQKTRREMIAMWKAASPGAVHYIGIPRRGQKHLHKLATGGFCPGNWVLKGYTWKTVGDFYGL